MVDTSELMGEYLNADTCKDGDIVEIIGEGTIVDLNKKKALNINVLLNGRKLIYTPAQKALKILNNVWGSESREWLGKKFQIKIILMEFQGKEMKVIRPMPLQ